MTSDLTAVHRMRRHRARARRRALKRVEFQVPAGLVPGIRRLVADVVAGHTQPIDGQPVAVVRPNAETVNDLAKLLLHRRIARRLVRQTRHIEAAKRIVATWPRDSAYAGDWARTLRQPLPEIIRLLTDPGERGRRLRNTSPFAALEGLAVTDPRARRRLWQLAKRTLERWMTTSVRSAR